MSLDGQTTIEPCEFCHEPAVEKIEITPAVYEKRGGVDHLVKHAVDAHVCAYHKDRVRGGVRLARTHEGPQSPADSRGQGTAQARPAEADLKVAA